MRWPRLGRRGAGGPRGERNGNYRDGLHTKEARAEAGLRWRCEARADEILEIADDSSKDYKLSHARMVVDEEAIARAKLRIGPGFG